MKVTFFFPDEEKLRPVDVRGVPPAPGSFVYFHTDDLNSKDRPNYDPGYDYNQRSKWVVAWVDFGVRTHADNIKRLKYRNQYYAEVHLKQYIEPPPDTEM